MPDNKAFKYHYRYPHPAVTADCVIFGFDGENLNVLLVRRGLDPYKGCWALPGGFMRMDESAEECARRELLEETGLNTAYVRQLRAYSAPDRDPRERVVTVAFYALVSLADVRGGDDAAEAAWFGLDELPQLAFDHAQILADAIAELRRQIHFEPIGFELLPQEFTVRELQALYEAILNVKFDRRNFYKKMLHLGILTQISPINTSSRNREPFRFRFNLRQYGELKRNGFKLEF